MLMVDLLMPDCQILSPKPTLRTWQEAKTPQKETHLNQPQCFRCELLVSGRVNLINVAKKQLRRPRLRNQGFTRPWAENEKRENRIIFIGRGMQPRRAKLTEPWH